jgi:transposase-like protein
VKNAGRSKITNEREEEEDAKLRVEKREIAGQWHYHARAESCAGECVALILPRTYYIGWRQS